MAGNEALNSNARSRKMVSEPILEEGVFSFDCSADDRNMAFPSFSFENPRVRETPIKNVDKVPTYFPTFECVNGQQIVNIEFPPSTSFYGTGEVSGQLERTGKRIDLRTGSTIKLNSSSSYPVITFGPFASPIDVLVSFSRAVGTIFMPPKWALGYHQCRWSYDSDARIHKGYYIYDSVSESDIWTQTADGKPYVGMHAYSSPLKVWPGPCVFPDFTQSKDFISNGVDGIWNDMNEPAVFKTVTKTMPESNIHRGDAELGGRQNHSHYHNVYGVLMAKSTYKGMKLSNDQKRPFVLTRAGFVGSQRYAATWTGDNLSTWEHFHMSIPMVIQLGLSGQPLSGPDIGGYAGNATPKLAQLIMNPGRLEKSVKKFADLHYKGDTEFYPSYILYFTWLIQGVFQWLLQPFLLILKIWS